LLSTLNADGLWGDALPYVLYSENKKSKKICLDEKVPLEGEEEDPDNEIMESAFTTPTLSTHAPGNTTVPPTHAIEPEKGLTRHFGLGQDVKVVIDGIGGMQCFNERPERKDSEIEKERKLEATENEPIEDFATFSEESSEVVLCKRTEMEPMLMSTMPNFVTSYSPTAVQELQKVRNDTFDAHLQNVYPRLTHDPGVLGIGGLIHKGEAVTRYVVLMDDEAVPWSSKKPVILALLKTEANGTSHPIVWSRSLINEFPNPGTLHGNNQNAIALNDERTKYDAHFYFISLMIAERKFKSVYLTTKNTIADTLTKALPSAEVNHFATSLGVRKD
jgi:hypothetical protein